MRFEKRPEQVDAIQWNGEGWEGRTPIWIVELESRGKWDYLLINGHQLVLNAGESISFLKVGDWLVMDTDQQKIYVIDNENFLRRFKRVGL